MFCIDVSNLHWLEGVNETEDLCLHGTAVVTIGEEHFEYHATVSSTALYLLKSLSEDHKIHESNQMLPCCGFFMIANETLSKVEILGCPNGIDWSVLHENGEIVLITEAGNITKLSPDEYQRTVFSFVDKIEAFYKQSAPKKTPKDEFEKNGYIAFWNEWKEIRMSNEKEILQAHQFCTNNKEELQKDTKCGCFSCLKIFDPAEIKEWVPDSKGTALCPYCGIDSVIGEYSGFPVTPEFLSKMKKYWFW